MSVCVRLREWVGLGIVSCNEAQLKNTFELHDPILTAHGKFITIYGPRPICKNEMYHWFFNFFLNTHDSQIYLRFLYYSICSIKKFLCHVK